MQLITRFLKALFNFVVGDWIILIGVAIVLVVVALLENLSAFSTSTQRKGFSPCGGY